MLSEDITNKRAEVTVKLMESLADAVDGHVKAGDAEATSKVADSLTFLIMKSHEIETLSSVADSAEKLTRDAVRRKKLDLGGLE